LVSGFEYTRAATASTLGSPKNAGSTSLSAVAGPEASRWRSAALIDCTPSQ
jgi:hypothetical protein